MHELGTIGIVAGSKCHGVDELSKHATPTLAEDRHVGLLENGIVSLSSVPQLRNGAYIHQI